MDITEQRVAREVSEEVSSELEKLGLLFRVFFRAKTQGSAEFKINTKNYATTGKKLQDPIGVRVTLYFLDDLDLAQDLLLDFYKNKNRFIDSTIDLPEDKMFCPKRINFVLRLNESHAKQLPLIRKHQQLVDSTFELQLRTVLSEGWHEVEHDLRYKCKEDWEDHSDLSRTMNGLVATLENCDWSMLQLFDQLSLRHYRQRNWNALVRSKFRLRFTQRGLSPRVLNVLEKDQELAKAVFRTDRAALLLKLAREQLHLPITPDNILFAANHYFIKNENLAKEIPPPIKDEFDRKRY